MLLEDILLAVVVGVVVLFAGVPIVRFLKAATPPKPRDPLAEAEERLRVAKREAEAARVNREADAIYERMYDEALADDKPAGPRVVTDEATAPSETPEALEEGKRNGQ
jgi:hypothetical protein